MVTSVSVASAATSASMLAVTLSDSSTIFPRSSVADIVLLLPRTKRSFINTQPVDKGLEKKISKLGHHN